MGDQFQYSGEYRTMPANDSHIHYLHSQIHPVKYPGIAVSIFYADPEAFNVEVYHRLIASIKRHTHKTSDEGKPLNISAGVWHGHSLDPQPTVNEVVASAQGSIELIQ